MNQRYAVITENDESAWDDVTGVKYHFPKKFTGLLTPGTWVVYYKGGIKNRRFAHARLSDRPHYFGLARLGEALPDNSSKKRDYFVMIEEYLPFDEPVLARDGDTYLERIPENKIKNYWRDAVREIQKDVFEKISSLGKHLADYKSTYHNTGLNDTEVNLSSGVEGKPSQKFVTVYERDTKLRDAAISIHGLDCSVCDFNFEKVYGQFGKGYIQIHHIRPISEAGGPVSVNPRHDLVPVCANCHAMIHREKRRTLSIDEARALFAGKK